MQTSLLGLCGSTAQECSTSVMTGLGVSGTASFLIYLLASLALSLNGPVGAGAAATSFAASLIYLVFSAWAYHSWLCRRIPSAVEAIATLERRRSSPRVSPSKSSGSVTSPTLSEDRCSPSTPMSGSSPGSDSPSFDFGDGPGLGAAAAWYIG